MSESLRGSDLGDNKSLHSDMSHADGGEDGGDMGFDLSLQNLNLKNGDLGFLTKFMTQFKKIKNIDMGDAKIQKAQMGELTKAI